jgi:hypothetical protein
VDYKPEHTVSMAHILSVEVEGIQDWIVGNSTELRAIRGGSLLLDRAFMELRDRLCEQLGEPDDASAGPPDKGWSLPVLSSGSLIAVVGARAAGHTVDVERLAAICRASLAGDLPTVRARVGVAPWRGPDGFADAKGAALAAGRPVIRRSAGRYVPGTMVCTSCGTASSNHKPYTSAIDWHLCAGCEQRVRSLESFQAVEGTKVTYELAQIGAAVPVHRWRGYIGIISADGNAIGAQFAGIRAPDELQRRSKALKAAVDANLAAAFEAAVADDRAVGSPSRELPVNLLVRAGDDIRLIVPAHVALAAAAALIEGEVLQGCAGIVLAHASMPFSDLHDHAEQLLTEAKTAARRADLQPPPPRLRFEVESAGRPRDLDDSDPASAGAYPASAVMPLLAAGDHLQAATHTLRRVADAVRTGGRVAAREWQLFLRRVDPEDRRWLAALWEALGADVEEGPTVPGGGSPIGDVLLVRSFRTADDERPT